MIESNVHGPVDFVLLEFPADGDLGRPAEAISDLVEAGTIRLYDIAVLRKSADGSVEALELASDSPLGRFRGARSGLLGDEDFATAADAMLEGTVAVLIVYENAWAIPFVAAAVEAGGEMVATARIPAQDLMEVLDDLERTG